MVYPAPPPVARTSPMRRSATQITPLPYAACWASTQVSAYQSFIITSAMSAPYTRMASWSVTLMYRPSALTFSERTREPYRGSKRCTPSPSMSSSVSAPPAPA